MSEQFTHAQKVLPNPHISAATEAVSLPREVADVEVALMNREQEAMRNGVDARILPLAGKVIEASEHARHMTEDSMTGLLNRRGFEMWFDRYAPEDFGILFADARGFKAINDKYGEEFGDRVISFIGKQFESRLRTDNKQSPEERREEPAIKDVVGISRWGGDEIFAVVDLSRAVKQQEIEELQKAGRTPQEIEAYKTVRQSEIMRKIQSRLEDFGTFDDEETGVKDISLQVRSVFEIGHKRDEKPLGNYIKSLAEELVDAKLKEK